MNLSQSNIGMFDQYKIQKYYIGMFDQHKIKNYIGMFD